MRALIENDQKSGGSSFGIDKSESREHLGFTLVIPALNEEEAVASTLERALAARQYVMENTPVKDMRVVLVNDGSTDRTQEIADKYTEVIKIRFEKNRGYGAAIMAGFDATDTELVGFMDADGTCEPRFLVQLINHLLNTKSDVTVGSRMTPESEMPRVRRLGNFIFARLICAVSGQAITDSASGMRVIRRSSLPHLHPLPTGLHFTPAMTCMALLDSRLRITEVPMPYKERVGESKLRVIKDGFRFLFIILFSTALFNPIKSLLFFAGLFCGGGVAGLILAERLGGSPVVLLAMALAFVVVFLQAAFVGFLSHQMLHMLLGPWRVSGVGEAVLQKYFWTKKMVWGGLGMFVASLLVFAGTFVMPSPWPTVGGLLSAFLILASGWTALAGVVLRVIWAAKERRIAEREVPLTAANK
jgi:glycosyltransferase involved in cell wall biosynthesis